MRSRPANGTRTAVFQPPHRQVSALQSEIGQLLGEALTRHDAESMVTAFSKERSHGPDGLAELLHELGISSPADLVDVLRVLTCSASYASLTWSRGLLTEAGTAYDVDDVRRSAWTQVSWVET